MKRGRKERLVFWLLIGLIAVIPAAYLMAQSEDTLAPGTTQIRFSGTVQAASAGGVIINGVLVDTRSISGFEIPPTGAIVNVTGALQADGSVSASVVEILSTGVIPGIVELRGTLITTPLSGAPLALQMGDSFTLISAESAVIADDLLLGDEILVYAESVDDPLVDWRALTVVRAGVPLPVVTPEVQPPASTPEAVSPIEAPGVTSPVVTPEVLAPVSTPEVSDDDSGRGRGRGRGGDDDDSDNSGDD